MTASVTSFLAPRLLGKGRHSCLLWLDFLFTVPLGIAPPLLFGTQDSHPLCYVSFLLLLLIQFGFFLFFLWVGVILSRGLC
jgi:hypothetical protein